MRRLDRYIVSNIAAAILLVMAIVLSLDFLFAFISEMNNLKNDYQTFEALMFAVTTLPRRIYDYLPLGAFMGCLIGLGALAKNSELVVIKAAGVSNGRIVYSAMKPAIVVVILGLFLGEFIAPYTEKIAQSQRAVAQGADSIYSAHSGFWLRDGDTFMHFNAVEPNGVLHGISLDEYDKNKQLIRSRFAKRAIFQRNSWQLENVIETEFLDGRTKVNHIPVVNWHTNLSPSLLSVLVIDPDSLSISGLYTYAQYLTGQGLSSAEYMMSFWKKVLQPFSTGVLVFVAISFVFGPLRSVTMGFRIFSGVFIGLLFKYAQDLLGPSSLVFGFNPVYATLIPIGIFSFIGFYLLRRVR